MRTQFIIIFFIAFFPFVTGVGGQQHSSSNVLGTITIGYCTNIFHNGAGEEGSKRLSAAVCFPASMMKTYKGSKIKALRIGFYNRSLSDLKLFVSDNLYGTFQYEQSVKKYNDGWNEFELTTPFYIDGSELYIGYSLNTLGNPIGFDNGPVNNLANYLCEDGIWSNVNDVGGSLCIQAILEGDSFTQYDITLKSIEVDKYVKKNQAFEIAGYVHNKGFKTINSFDVSYKVGDEEKVTKRIEGVEISNNREYKFMIPGVMISNNGKNEITVTVDNLNGNSDENFADNTKMAEVQCLSDIAIRKVLVENFTTAGCVFCPSAHDMLENSFGKNKNIIIIGHHVGYGTDAYTVPDASQYLKFYGGNIYAPAVMADRTCPSFSIMAPVMGVDNNTIEYIKERLNEPAFVSIDLRTVYEESDQIMNLDVLGEFFMDIKEKCFLTVYITEDGLIGYQEGRGANYTHNHVVRSIVTQIFGDQLDITNGKFSKSYKVSIANGWVPDNLKVVALVSKYDPNNITRCQIFNAEQTTISNWTGIEENKKPNVLIYLEIKNKTLYVDEECISLSIYDSFGTLVKLIHKPSGSLNLDELNNGVYFVRISNGKEVFTEKICIP